MDSVSRVLTPYKRINTFAYSMRNGAARSKTKCKVYGLGFRIVRARASGGGASRVGGIKGLAYISKCVLSNVLFIGETM